MISLPSTAGIVAAGNKSSPAWASAWRTAWNTAITGGTQAHIACYGDSLTQGYYATEPYYANGWVGRLATLLNTRTGVTAGSGWFRVSEEPEVVDARISRSGTWTDSSGAGIFNQFSWAASGGTFTFGPITCDGFRMLNIKSSFGGAWTAQIDSEAVQNNTSNAGSTSNEIITLNAASRGSHTLTLTSSGAGMFVIAVEAVLNGTSGGVKVSRIGRSGETATTLNASGSAQNSRPLALALAPNLAIVGMGLNDSNATTAAAFETQLTNFVQGLKSGGASVILVAEPNPAVGWSSGLYVSGGFAQKVRDVAAAESTGLIDFPTLWGGGYAENPSWYSDQVHPNNTGHEQMANTIYRYVLDAVKA